jgi:hypothetical protein
MGWWVRLYLDHTSFIMGSPFRHGWPGGVDIGAQPSLLVEMFDEIEAGIMKQMEIDSGR